MDGEPSKMTERGWTELSTRERLFLEGLAQGDTPKGYAFKHGYSIHWAKWISRQLRRKLGVATLREALELSTGAEVTRADLDAITRAQAELRQALDDLREASTEGERRSAQRDVTDARSDLADELQRRRLTLKDLDRIEQIKEDERLEAWYAKKQKEEEDAKPKRRRKKPKIEETPAKAKREPNAFEKLFMRKDETEDDEEPDEDDAD